MSDISWKDLPNPTQAEIEEAGVAYYGDGERTANYIMLLRQKKVRQSHEITTQTSTITELQEHVVYLEGCMAMFEESLKWIANTKIHTWTNDEDGIRQMQKEAQRALQNVVERAPKINSRTDL